MIEHPDPLYARVQGTPYSLPDWPGRVGFAFLPAVRCWHRPGGWTLTQISTKYWLLGHPDFDRPRRIVTRCHHPESIALDLAWQVRELVEPA